MRTTIITIAAALLAATTQAQAATPAAPDVQWEGSWTVKAPVQREFVYLQRGRSYAVAGTSGWCSTFVVHRPGGAIVARSATPADPDSYDVGVAEWVAPVTGSYLIEARGDPCGTGLTRAVFDAGVYRDCLGSARTLCRLYPDGTWTGAHLFAADQDWIGVPMVAGRSYTLGGALDTPQGRLVLRDASGREVVGADLDFATGTASIAGFVPALTGTYYLDLDCDCAGHFTLTVTQP